MRETEASLCDVGLSTHSLRVVKAASPTFDFKLVLIVNCELSFQLFGFIAGKGMTSLIERESVRNIVR
ncbi:MAG: hypothetical protein FWE49_03820, partial [Synergistaceae bacterium]|nr:hypothetical protein [Synergistaceae bacterium]